MADYDPSSASAMFATIIEKLKTHAEKLDSMWIDVKADKKLVTDKLEEHQQAIEALQKKEEVHSARLKWAVTVIAVLGWSINAFISWWRSRS